MNAGIDLIETALQAIWRASWQASVLAGIVLLLQWILRGQVSARGRYLLWAVVLIRLLIPVLPQSRASIFNLHPFKSEPIHEMVAPQIVLDTAPPPVRSSGDSSELTSPTAASPRFNPLSYLRIAAIAWAVGVLLLSIRVGWACVRLSRLMRLLSAPRDPRLIAMIDSSAASLGFAWRPIVRCGDAVRRPALVGVWRPTLLLPARVLEQCDPAEIRLIVLHELAHLKRRDVASNWIITLATLLHWFNPVVWIVAARMRADRELACDEMVLADSGGREAQAYGRTLLKLVEILAPAPAAPGQLVGILEASGPMQRRVLMIAKFDPRRSSRWMWAMVILLLLCGIALTDAVSEKASAAAPAPATAPAPVQAMTDEAIQAQLNKLLPEVKFDGNPMSDVVEFLRDVTQANLLVDWRVLTDFGIDKDTKVSLQLRGVTFGQALDHILRNVGGNAVSLGYMVKSGAIVVTTQEKIAQENQPTLFQPAPPPPPAQRTVYYDVRDLVDLTGDQSNDARIKELVRVILDTPILTDKGTRASVGENRSFNVQGFGTKLIITTTEEGHKHVADLLAHLREKPTTRPR